MDMDFETFNELIQSMREAFKHENDIYRIGIDLSSFSEILNKPLDIAIKVLFNPAQLDHFEWWLYDQDGIAKNPTNVNLWNEFGKPINVSDERKFYDFLMSLKGEEERNGITVGSGGPDS